MEHGQQTGESIGAMLASIASTLREVGDKLDAVAARMDGTRPAEGDKSLENRLAALEAWAFRARQDISGIDARVERLESGESAPPAETSAAAERPAPPLPRAAAGRRSAENMERHAATPTAPALPERSRQDAGGSRNGVRRQDSPALLHSHEQTPPPSRHTPPREPEVRTLESNGVPRPGFTVPTDREPAPNFTAATGAESPPEFVAAREPAPPRPEAFGAPADAAGSHSYPQPERAPYENLVSGNGAVPMPAQAVADNGVGAEPQSTGLTGSHRAEPDPTPVDNSHVDKLQAMLDELKRNAAAPLSRSDVFSSPSSETNPTERTDTLPQRTNDYRLSSPPSMS